MSGQYGNRACLSWLVEPPEPIPTDNPVDHLLPLLMPFLTHHSALLCCFRNRGAYPKQPLIPQLRWGSEWVSDGSGATGDSCNSGHRSTHTACHNLIPKIPKGVCLLHTNCSWILNSPALSTLCSLFIQQGGHQKHRYKLAFSHRSCEGWIGR